MMDKKLMRSHLKNMERIAESILQHDAAFYEALHALKWEIDSDPAVQTAILNLQAAGHSVFNSFVPRIKVRIRTEQGVFTLAKSIEMPGALAVERVDQLTQELKSAANTVIQHSRHCQELNEIVSEAVAANNDFDVIATEIEDAGCKVLMSLDLSAYAQVRATSTRALLPEKAGKPNSSDEPVEMEFSAHDLSFLRALKIKADNDVSA